MKIKLYVIWLLLTPVVCNGQLNFSLSYSDDDKVLTIEINNPTKDTVLIQNRESIAEGTRTSI